MSSLPVPKLYVFGPFIWFENVEVVLFASNSDGILCESGLGDFYSHNGFLTFLNLSPIPKPAALYIFVDGKS